MLEAIAFVFEEDEVVDVKHQRIPRGNDSYFKAIIWCNLRA
jgi:hypothetical protein